MNEQKPDQAGESPPVPRATAAYKARAAAGLCIRGCGKPPSKGKTRCRWCAVKQKAYQRRWRAKVRTHGGQ
jgi:hypothetical protein